MDFKNNFVKNYKNKAGIILEIINEVFGNFLEN